MPCKILVGKPALPPGNCFQEQKFAKTRSQQLDSNYWFNTCNDSLLTGLTITLHKNQVHCSGVMQWWVWSSPMSAALPPEQGAKLASRLFYCWFLLRNNNMATNLQMFTSSHGSRRFAACDCWTQTSLARLALLMPNSRNLNFLKWFGMTKFCLARTS